MSSLNFTSYLFIYSDLRTELPWCIFAWYHPTVVLGLCYIRGWMPFSVATLPFAAVFQPPVTAKLPHSLAGAALLWWISQNCLGPLQYFPGIAPGPPTQPPIGGISSEGASDWLTLSPLSVSVSHDTLTLATLTASEESLRLRWRIVFAAASRICSGHHKTE